MEDRDRVALLSEPTRIRYEAYRKGLPMPEIPPACPAKPYEDAPRKPRPTRDTDFTPTETAFIQEHFVEKGAKWVGAQLGRKPQSISTRAWRMGLKRGQKKEAKNDE